MSQSTLQDLGARSPRAVEFGRDALVVCDNLVRIYQSGSIEMQALQGLDLLVDAGEMVAIVGASGSGKSTPVVGALRDRPPTAGRVRVGPWGLMALSGRDRVDYRRSMVGFVWQQTVRNLVPYLTATQNVTLPPVAGGVAGGPPSREPWCCWPSGHGGQALVSSDLPVRADAGMSLLWSGQRIRFTPVGRIPVLGTDGGTPVLIAADSLPGDAAALGTPNTIWGSGARPPAPSPPPPSWPTPTPPPGRTGWPPSALLR
jgi:hypothetical protein